MQPGWSNKRKRLSGYSDVIGSDSYSEQLWVQQQNTEKAKALYADSQVAAGTHVRNPDGSITEKSPGFLDYVIGSKSIFGQESSAKNARRTSQGVDWVRDVVDEYILGEKGNDEFDSAKDVVRFAINLVPGMIEGLFNAPKNFNEAITGERVNFDEEGNMLAEREKLTATQQAAAGAVGALDSAGLALGGSGKFIKGIFKKPLEAGLKTAAKSTIAKEAGKTAGRIATEGLEESLSSVAEDLQDDSQLSEDWVSNAGKSFLLGTAAGGIFDVSGRAIGSAKDAAATSKVNKATGTTPDIRKGIAERISAADDLSQEQKTAYANSLAEIGQTVSPVSDANMRTQEFNARADEALKQAKQVKTENANTTGTTLPSVSPERAARLRSIDNKLNQRLSDIENQQNAIKDNTDTTIQRVVANDGTDVTEAAQKFEKEIRDKEAQIRDLQLQAEGVDLNTDTVTPPEGVDPSTYTGDTMGRSNAAERVIKLKQEIADLEAERTGQFEMLGGVQTVIDTKLARDKFAELNRQKYEALDWKIRNNIGETPDSLAQLKEEISRGVVSDEFVHMREPVDSIESAVAMAKDSDPNDSTEIQRAAVINQLHREAANAKLERLWTPEKAQQREAVLDENYKLSEAEIKELPKPKQEEQLATLIEEYNIQRMENRARAEEDADEVAAAQRALEIADDIDARIVDRANSILESDPMAFGKVNPEEMIEIESGMDVALTLKKVETAPDTVSPIESEGAVTQAIRNTADVEEASIIIDEDPRLSDQAATVIADQVSAGNLKGQIWDTFFVTNRQALLKLDNGDKIVNIMDGALREMAISDDTMKVRSIVDKWKLAYKNEAVSDQTIAFLDQGEPISKMSGESDARFKERTKAVNSIRAYLDDAAKRRGLRRNSEVDKDVEALEATRTEENSADIDKQIAELNSKRMVDNYFAHVHTDMGINVESAAEALARLEAGVNEKGNKLTQKQRDMLNRKIEGLDIGTQQIIARQRIYTVGKDGHAIKRKGAEGWSRDIPFVLDVYQRATNRSVYMQPAIDQVKSLTSDLSGRQLTFVEDTINAVAGRKTRSDELLGDKGVKVLRTTRRFSNMALMGASARTIILQPTAILNNWRLDAELGGGTKQFIASTLKSIKAANLPIRQSPALQEFLSAGGMQGSWSTSLRTNKGSKFESALFSGIALMDRNLRFAAYDMGKQTYLKNNAKDPKNPTSVEYDAAKRAGVQAATEAQFGLGPLDVPLAQNSEVNKAIFQLQQFNMKQMGREVSLLLGDKDGSLVKVDWQAGSKMKVIKSAHLTKKGAKNLLKTIAGYYAIYSLYTQFQVGDDEDSKNPFGLDFEDLIPFGEQVSALVELMTTGKVENEVQAVLPPIWTGLFGRGGQDKGVAGHLFNAMIGGEDVDRGDELASMMQSAIRQFMPMGTQLNRSYQGGKAVIDGESQNKSGSTRFLIDNSSGWNIMKGLVAGQYATTEGQEWLRNGMNTIPKDQTIEFDGRNMPVSEFVRNHIQDPAIKAQYIGYYATKQNAQKEMSKSGISTASVVKDIRTRLAAGYISQAQAVHEIQQHNQLLIDLYRPYMQGNKNMPKYVTLDFMEDVLVDENVTPLQVR